MCRRNAAQVSESVENDLHSIGSFPLLESPGFRRQFEGRFQALALRTFDAAFECPVQDGAVDFLDALIQAIRPLVGYSQHHDAPPLSWQHLIHLEDHEVVTTHVHRVLGGNRDICVFRVTTTCGEVRWMSALTRPLQECTDQRASYVYGLVKLYPADCNAMPAREEEETTASLFHRFVRPAPQQEDDAGTYAPA